MRVKRRIFITVLLITLSLTIFACSGTNEAQKATAIADSVKETVSAGATETKYPSKSFSANRLASKMG